METSVSSFFSGLFIFLIQKSISQAMNFNLFPLNSFLGFPDSSVGKKKKKKNPHVMQETLVWFLGGKIPWKRDRLPVRGSTLTETTHAGQAP